MFPPVRFFSMHPPPSPSSPFALPRILPADLPNIIMCPPMPSLDLYQFFKKNRIKIEKSGVKVLHVRIKVVTFASAFEAYALRRIKKEFFE